MGKHSTRVQVIVLTVLVVLAVIAVLATLAFATQNLDRSIDAIFGLFRISAKPDPSVEKCRIVVEAKSREMDSIAGQIVNLIQVEKESALKVADLRVKFLNENIEAPIPSFWSSDQRYSSTLIDQQNDFNMRVRDRNKAQEQQRVLMKESQALKGLWYPISLRTQMTEAAFTAQGSSVCLRTGCYNLTI